MTNEDTAAGFAEAPAGGGDLEVRVARELIDKARADGVSLVGPDGLLRQLTKTVLETALNAEMDDHLGYVKGDREAKFGSNERNGSSGKTVRTDVGEVRIDVPRDREGTFAPRIVPKYARRVEGFDDTIISLYAKGLTTGEIQAHLADVYDADVSRDLISKITDKVVEEMNAWQARPLDRIYPVVLVDAIHVKIRDGQVANRPVYVAVGITLAGERDVLGMWVGTGGEGAKGWLNHLSDLKNRGVDDILIVACDGLKGLPDAIAALWPQAEVQLCVVHLVRASLRYASKKYWPAITKQLKLIYTAPNADAAETEFSDFCAEWEGKYPAMIRLWRNNWENFTPFLAYPPELRRLIYTTNAIESLNARFRQATRRRGHFPNEQAALKVLYLVIKNPLKNRSNITGKVVGWKNALNTLAMHYGSRLDA